MCTKAGPNFDILDSDGGLGRVRTGRGGGDRSPDPSDATASRAAVRRQPASRRPARRPPPGCPPPAPPPPPGWPGCASRRCRARPAPHMRGGDRVVHGVPDDHRALGGISALQRRRGAAPCARPCCRRRARSARRPGRSAARCRAPAPAGPAARGAYMRAATGCGPPAATRASSSATPCGQPAADPVLRVVPVEDLVHDLPLGVRGQPPDAAARRTWAPARSTARGTAPA